MAYKIIPKRLTCHGIEAREAEIEASLAAAANRKLVQSYADGTAWGEETIDTSSSDGKLRNASADSDDMPAPGGYRGTKKTYVKAFMPPVGDPEFTSLELPPSAYTARAESADGSTIVYLAGVKVDSAQIPSIAQAAWLWSMEE